MAEIRRNILKRPNVTFSWALAIGLGWFAALSAFSLSAGGSYVNGWFAEPINFWIRDVLGQSVKPSPQLKLLVIDDKTFAKWEESWALPIDRWAVLLKGIDARKPKGIFIDHLWSKVVDPDGRIDDAIAILKGRSAPIVVGAKASPSNWQSVGHPLEMSDDDFSLAARTDSETVGEGLALQDVSLKDYSAYQFFGPSPALKEAIDHVGHILFAEGGRVEPILKRDFATIMPHMFLHAADEWSLARDHLIVDGRPVYFDSDGMTPINFFKPSFDIYTNKTVVPLGNLLTKASQGLAFNEINPGDTVLILPLFFTGSTDFKWTPYGSIPAGFVPAALINSVLLKNWLRPVGFDRPLIFAGIALGIFVAWYTGPVSFWLAVWVLAACAFSLVMAAFSYLGWQINWLIPGLGYVAGSLTVYAKKIRTGEEKIRALRQALEGSIGDEGLAEALRKPEQVNLDAQELIVTVMFVDIVGFSLVSENMLPRTAFEALKTLLDAIAKTIHEFGGRVDKTLGDGMLCYFGYDIATNQVVSDHPEKALRAAVKIQEDNIQRLLAKFPESQSLMPLRVGLNTSPCFAGNLGSGSRIDFTIIGNGVNFAKRLEGACETNRIMMSKTTYDLVKDLDFVHGSTVRREIKIKHHDVRFEAYELDPVVLNPQFQSLIEKLQKKKSLSASRHAVRVSAGDEAAIRIECGKGPGRLRDFSLTGLSIVLPAQLETATLLEFKLSTPDRSLESAIEINGLKNLIGEVRWSFSEGANFVHGISLTRMDKEEKRFLYESLQDYMRAHVQAGIAS